MTPKSQPAKFMSSTGQLKPLLHVLLTLGPRLVEHPLLEHWPVIMAAGGEGMVNCTLDFKVAFPLSFLWLKQVMWPCLTSKAAKRCNAVIHTESKELEIGSENINDFHMLFYFLCAHKCVKNYEISFTNFGKIFLLKPVYALEKALKF